MFNMFSVDEWQIIGTIATVLTMIVTAITAMSSIYFSRKALEQTNAMVEESTRPNIQIYPVHTNGFVYIVIKNFGQSTATITKIECNHIFTRKETLGDDIGENPFEVLSGSLMCSGYSVKCPLISYEVAKTEFVFTVKYSSKCKTYEDEFKFTPYNNAPFSDLSPSKKSTVEENLNQIAKEIRAFTQDKL